MPVAGRAASTGRCSPRFSTRVPCGSATSSLPNQEERDNLRAAVAYVRAERVTALFDIYGLADWKPEEGS